MVADSKFALKLFLYHCREEEVEVEEEVEEGYGSCMMEERLPHHSWDWRAQSEVLARLGTQITSLSSSSSEGGETRVSQDWWFG